MEPRSQPAITPNHDDGPFSPGDVVRYDDGRPSGRFSRNWLDDAGGGVVLGCRIGRIGPHMPCCDWVCTVESRPPDRIRGGTRIKRATYLARYLKLIRPAYNGPGWKYAPVSEIQALRAADV